MCIYKEGCGYEICNESTCIRKLKIDDLFKRSQLPLAKRQKTALRVDGDGVDLEEYFQLKEIGKNIVEFVNRGQNLYLHSANAGNGKTSWAIKLIQNYIYRTWRTSELRCTVLFIDVPKFLEALKANISNKNEYAEYIKENVSSADLVIWDDIACKNASEYEINQLMCFINDRINNCKSNVYTSNIDERQMYEVLGERLASRICHFSIDICLHGADKRKLGIGGIDYGNGTSTASK